MSEWKTSDLYEVAIYWPSENDYGGWSSHKTLAEAEAEADRLQLTGSKKERVHIRRVQQTRIR